VVWGGHQPEDGQAPPCLANIKWLLEKTTARLKRIRRWTRTIVFLTLGLIDFCFVGLATTPRMSDFMLDNWQFCARSAVNVPVVLALLGAAVILLLYEFITWSLTEPADYRNFS
jgi:hypothetical protein